MNKTDTPDVAVVVLSSVPHQEAADRIARILVEERLAACVSRVPGVTSLFHWNDKIETAEEILLVIKTHAAKAPALTHRLSEVHPYEVPEILVLPVAAGQRNYLDWIRTETGTSGAGA